MTALRVFRPAESECIHDTLTLIRDVLESHVLPEIEARGAAATARKYENAIAGFTAFLANGTRTTSSRATDPISDLECLKWQQDMISAGLAPSTINGKWRLISAVLRRMGPRGAGNPRGLGLVESVPYLQPLVAGMPHPAAVDLRILDAIYRYGTPDMSWPRPHAGVPTSANLRAWLCCAYNLAMRTRDLLSLKWDAVHWDPISPSPHSDSEHPHGWILFVPAKTSRRKPHPILLPMAECVRRHLESIRHDGRFVFGAEMSRCSNRKLYGCRKRPGEWYRLLDYAATHVEGGFRRFPIKAMRSTSNTQYNRISRGLGAHVLGHAKRGVNDLFYQQWEAELIDAVNRLPQPESFTAGRAAANRQTMFI
tara:strand:+ start:3283 stop:4383 length:1101 start_codon:yes stop_codon:yes gene_type:complete